MELTREDYEAYEESMKANERVQMMALWASEIVLAELKTKIKKFKK